MTEAKTTPAEIYEREINIKISCTEAPSLEVQSRSELSIKAIVAAARTAADSFFRGAEGVKFHEESMLSVDLRYWHCDSDGISFALEIGAYEMLQSVEDRSYKVANQVVRENLNGLIKKALAALETALARQGVDMPQ